MKVLVVNAYGSSNRGDAVLLEECLADIKQSYPSASLTVALFRDQALISRLGIEHHSCERIGTVAGRSILAKVKTLWLLCVCWVGVAWPRLGAERLLPKRQTMTIEAYREADLVVSAPGGYIHDTNFSYWIALFHILLAQKLGKPVVLAPQSIGPIKGRFSRLLARGVLAHAQCICAREEFTYEFLTRELQLPCDIVRRSGDAAFWNLEIGTQEAAANDFAKLGVTDRDRILGMTVVNWSFPKASNPQRLYSEYVGALATVAEHFSKEYGLLPVIFNQVAEDLPTAYDVQRTARCRIIVDNIDRPPPALRALIKRSTVFLGTRFHSCIFAMLAGRPTFAISYLPKTEGIMKDLGFRDGVTPIDDVDEAKVIEKLALDLADITAAEARVQVAIESYRKSRTRLADILLGAAE